MYGFVVKQRSIYCGAFHDLANQFTLAGQKFLICAAKCKALELWGLFEHGFKPCCGSMELWGLELARNNCMLSCDFCKVFLDNVVGFIALFDVLFPGEDTTVMYLTLCRHKEG